MRMTIQTAATMTITITLPLTEDKTEKIPRTLIMTVKLTLTEKIQDAIIRYIVRIYFSTNPQDVYDSPHFASPYTIFALD